MSAFYLTIWSWYPALQTHVGTHIYTYHLDLLFPILPFLYRSHYALTVPLLLLICELQLNLKSPSAFFYKDSLVHNLLDRLTSFPAALQMALCSSIFAVSSRYNSMASMILSACTEDGKEIIPTHTHQPKTQTREGLASDNLNRLNKDMPVRVQRSTQVSGFFLIFNL